MRLRRFNVLAGFAAVLLSVPAALEADFTFSGTIRNLVADPQNPNLLWGSTGVLYRSQDQGKTWQGIRFHSNPSNASPIVKIAVDPKKTGTVFVLTDSSGGYLWTSPDGGNTWNNSAAAWTPNLTPRKIVVTTSQLVYVQIGSQLRKSTDGGIAFDGGVDTPCQTAIEGSPADPRRLACAGTTDGFLYTSTDEGVSWSRGGRPTSGTVVGCELVNDLRNADLYFGYCLTTENGLQHDAYFRSTDGLKTLTTSPSATGLPVFFVSPDRMLILAGGASGLARSRNLGASWEIIASSAGTSYGFSASDSNVVYRNGTARSTDGGVTFTNLNSFHIPLLATIPPLDLKLESGTAYEPNIGLKDLAGSTFLLSGFSPSVPAGVSWISTSGSRFVINAGSLAPGNYETSISLVTSGVAAGQIPVRLEVTARRDPPLFYRATAIAGTGSSAPEETGVAGPFPGDGGPAASSPIASGQGPLTTDPSGNVYMATRYRVRRISPSGTVTTIAGSGASAGTGNGGLATQASFRSIGDILWTPDGLLIADYLANVIRRVREDGNIEAFYTGTSAVGISLDSHMALDSGNAVYLSNSTGVYKFQNNAFVLVFRHADIVPLLNGSRPANRGFAIDRSDNSIVMAYQDRILRYNSAGQVTLLAGTPGSTGFAGDGNTSASGSLIDNPFWIAVDRRRNVFFAVPGRLRVITANGTIGTVAGDGNFANPLPANAYATSGSTDDALGVTVNSSDEVFLLSLRRYLYRLQPANAPSPQLAQGAVVSLAAGAARVGQGAIFSLYGADLAGSTASNTSVPLPTTLAGDQVEVNGQTVPLFYVSPGQINAQMPFETPVGSARVRVRRGANSSSEVTVRVTAAGPDILQYGQKRAVAVNPSGAINGPSSPAPAGSVVVLYLTGIGPVTPATTTGAAASGTDVSRAALDSRVTLNNREVPLLFLGLTPGFVGLAQANIQLPDDLTAADYTLVLTVGGEDSNPVFLAVGN